ncbi:MAG: LysM peptidoglycan-binding domain-containing protein [Proteobacteria bacterium]|nr:LysM peptidoglycan-binding domain-containing protein [Pseudomonadota bacterium]
MLNRLKKFNTALVFSFAVLASGAFAQTPKPAMMIKADAPARYTVVKGDTLWSIAERFTDAPWRWSELWNLNKDKIRNPDRIFPGDVIVLDRARGKLALSGTVKLSPRVHAEMTRRSAVPSIPPSVIEPFLSRPLVIEPTGLDKAPSIVGTEDDRVIISAGQSAYVSGMSGTREENWHVYRKGGALVDPDTKTTLGYEAIYLGAAQLVRPGDPATVRLTSTVQEVLKGDRLIAVGKPVSVQYAPHAPTGFKGGRVMSIYGGIGKVGESGRHSIVTVNRGASDGLEPGHVVALLHPVETTAGRKDQKIEIAQERYGLAYVFRVFDRVSYALVMNVTRHVLPNDVVQTP